MAPIVRWPYKTHRPNLGESANAKINALFEEIAPAFRYGPFYTRELFVERFDLGAGKFFPDVGSTASAGVVEYVYDGTSTEILDLPGWRPLGPYTPQHFGSTGTIKERVNARVYGWTLADRFETLAEAQAVFPKATDLAETIDDHAWQRMVDAVRDLSDTLGSGELADFRQSVGASLAFYLPYRSQYVLTRSVDFTGIRPGQGHRWTLTGDQAVIFNQCIGATGLDMLHTNLGSFAGFTIINELIRGVGCPRSGILTGRNSSGLPGGNHTWDRTVNVIGFSTLGAMHVYGSELTKFECRLSNSLDPRNAIADYDTASAGTFTAGEAVTWTGSGEGTILSYDSTTIGIHVTNGTLEDNFTVTTAGGRTFIVRDVWYQPAGEGPTDKSFALVLDGSNHWGTESAYQTNASINSGVSFIDNYLPGAYSHLGHGSAVWMDSQAQDFDFSNAYFVAYSNTCAAMDVYFGSSGNTINLMRFSSFDSESDLGGDETTGQGWLFNLYAPTNKAVFLKDWTIHHAKSKFSYGMMHTESTVTSVRLDNVDYSLASFDDNTGQTIFTEPSKFTVSGKVSAVSTQAGYLNVVDWAKNTADIICADRFSDDVVTNDSFFISDETGVSMMHQLQIINADGAAASGRLVFVDGAGTVIGYIEHNGSNMRTSVLGGEEIVQGPASVYPLNNNTVSLGLNAARFSVAYATNLDYSSQVRYQGTKVLGAQGAAIADSSGGDEQAKINAILAAMRTHGLIAT